MSEYKKVYVCPVCSAERFNLFEAKQHIRICKKKERIIRNKKKIKCIYCSKEIERKKLNRLFNFCSIKHAILYSLQKLRELEAPTFD